MATLTVRDLDDDIHARLRVRAARHGRSMEAEVREILRTATAPSQAEHGLGTSLREHFRSVAVELDIPRRTEMPRAVDLS